MSVPLSEQKVAIITGASAGEKTRRCSECLANDVTKGIGRATAIALSASDWRLVITARRATALEETAKLCSGYLPAIVVGDIADEETVIRVFETAKTAYGKLRRFTFAHSDLRPYEYLRSC